MYCKRRLIHPWGFRVRLKCPVFSLNGDLRLDTQDKKKSSLSTQRRKVLKPLAIDLRLINSRVNYGSVSLSSFFLRIWFETANETTMWRNAIISETSLLKTIPDLIMAVFSLSCRDFSQSMFQDSQQKPPQHHAIISATSCLKLSTGNTSTLEWKTYGTLGKC